MDKIEMRPMKEGDCVIISQAFLNQNWYKPFEQYKGYLREMNEGKRDVIMAFVDNDFAGYVSVVYDSSYEYFRSSGIPEIKDLNVLLKYRGLGIGKRLIQEAEAYIKKRSDIAGIGVGLSYSYGNAQRLYIKLGYIADGKGIWKDDHYVKHGEAVVIDDSVAIYMMKELR